MKNINVKISLWFVSLIFLMTIANQISAQTECDSLIKVIVIDPPIGPPTGNPPVVTDPPVGDPNTLGPEDGDEYLKLYSEPIDYERHVILVHGLEGSSNSWSRVRPWIENGHGQDNFLGWKTIVPTMDYTANQDNLPDAGSELNEELLAKTSTDILKSDNIIIAHSMGGLVSRQLDKDYSLPGKDPKPYGGLITFGTPHLGSPAASYLYNNKELLRSFLQKSCIDLAKGPATELQFVNLTPFIGFLGNINFFNLSDLVESICTTSNLLDGIVDNMFSPIVQDLVPGNPVLNDLNSYYDPNINKMAFYGVEDDDKGQLTWSLAYTGRTGANSTDLFLAGDNNDFHAIEEMNNAHKYYSGKYEMWNTISENYNTFYTCCPFCYLYRSVLVDQNGDGLFDNFKCITRKNVRTMRDAFRAGRDYSYQLNEIWKNIIGTYDNMEITGYYCRYSEINPYDGSYDEYIVEVNDPSECDDSNPNYLGYEETISVTAEDSDGLVLKSSAEAFPGVNFLPQKMPGSNHFQMRNDENTEAAMNGIFNGLYLKFFETLKR